MRAAFVPLLLALIALAFSASGASAAESRLFQEAFGPDGTPATTFEHAAAIGVDQSTGATYVAEKSAGTVQKFNAAHEPEEFSPLAPGVNLEGRLTGFAFSANPAVSQIAVDSTSHVFFVAALEGGAVKAFQPDGEPANFTAGTAAGTNELAGSEPCGVAVDANGAIYVSFADGVHVYTATGEQLTPFAPAPFFPCNLAVDSHGAVYAAPFGGGVDKFTPSEFPVTESTTYGEPPVTVDETIATAVAVDPATDDVFVDEGKQVAEYDSAGKRLGAFASEGQAALTASEGLAVNSTAQKIYVSDAEGKHHVGIFVPLPPPPPRITGESATNLTTETADLNVNVNPGGQETTCVFEYGTDTAYTASPPLPCTPQPGKGTTPVTITQHLTGLAHDHTYHWRVVATNAAGTTTGPDHTFIYTTTEAGALPDNRAYEMVTPPVKNAAEIGTLFAGLAPAVAVNGSRLILTTLQCFGDAGSCQSVRGGDGTPFAFSRGSGGWVAHALAPPSSQVESSSTVVVNPDTGDALVSAPTPPSGQDEYFVRHMDGTQTDIGPATPPELGAKGAQTFASRTTADFSRLVVENHRAGWPFETSVPSTLVEYSGAGGAPVPVGVVGGAGSTAPISACGTGLGSETGFTAAVESALSADGRMVFFTADECPPAVPANELYVRVDGAESVKVSASECGAGSGAAEVACRAAPQAAAEFQGASVNGTKAFFTSTQQLTDNASEDSNPTDSASPKDGCTKTAEVNGCNLYEWDSTAGAGHRLTALSVGDVSGGGPRVQGVAAISNDGSHVYFVARGVLDVAANGQGVKAKDGAPNLYVSTGGAVRFIATLSDAPGSGVGPPDAEMWRLGQGVANVSSDGRFLVFMSRDPLTKDDTRPKDGPPQVFRYDALTGELVRVSIGADGFNDNGNAGLGEARIALPFTLAEVAGGSGRRDATMSDDGRRVFFQSPIGLTPKALNDAVTTTSEGRPFFAQNVYEWEQPGAGSCPAGRAGGCVFLISDGRDTVAASTTTCGQTSSAVCLIATDETGSNVFFTTGDPLVPGDTDTQLDFYDARVCEPEHGNPCVTAAPAPLPPCLGEACHGVPPATPGAPNAPSATFNGAGNVTPPPQGGPTKSACSSASGAPSRSCTRRQNLTKALASCKRRFPHSKKKRATCERTAHRKYGPVKRKKSASKRGG